MCKKFLGDGYVKTSVAMATYNGEKYIEEQLNSIANQTVLPNEIIICDDLSSDNTEDIITKFKENNKNIDIQFYKNEKNVGYVKNFEKCISKCTGDIIFLCDQDDVWMENKIEKFINVFEENTNVVFAFSDAYVTDENLNIIKQSNLPSHCLTSDKKAILENLENYIYPYGMQIVVKNEFVRNILPMKYGVYGVHDFWLSINSIFCGDVYPIKEKLVLYRRHSKAVSQSFMNVVSNKKNSYIKLFFERDLKLSFGDYFAFYYQKLTWIDYLMKTYKNSENNFLLTLLSNDYDYLTSLESMRTVNYRKRMKILMSLLKKGLYQKYRGSKHLPFDIIYLIKNPYNRNK